MWGASDGRDRHSGREGVRSIVTDSSSLEGEATDTRITSFKCWLRRLQAQEATVFWLYWTKASISLPNGEKEELK